MSYLQTLHDPFGSPISETKKKLNYFRHILQYIFLTHRFDDKLEFIIGAVII